MLCNTANSRILGRAELIVKARYLHTIDFYSQFVVELGASTIGFYTTKNVALSMLNSMILENFEGASLENREPTYLLLYLVKKTCLLL